MRSAFIPNNLREGLEREASALPPAELAAAARRLSEAYRLGQQAGQQAGQPIRLHRRTDLAAYALTRMPATFAALSTVFAELPASPRSLVDFGAGPGTSLWAAQAVFDETPSATLIEQNTNWRAFAEQLGLPAATWRHADVRRLDGAPDVHDLAVLSYVLNELSKLDAARVLRQAWDAAGSALVLLEPGTPAGFALVLEARRQLIEWGAHIAAPCPHAAECPLQKPDWCHFAVRVDRTRAHRFAKGGELGYEDEKFSYVVATRQAPQSVASRVLRHPLHSAGRAELKLCTPSGLETLIAGKKHPDWKQARKASWGDRWQARGEANPSE
jgi:ribosomal protein RSM22 (predicted rRNA methylase)